LSTRTQIQGGERHQLGSGIQPEGAGKKLSSPRKEKRERTKTKGILFQGGKKATLHPPFPQKGMWKNRLSPEGRQRRTDRPSCTWAKTGRKDLHLGEGKGKKRRKEGAGVRKGNEPVGKKVSCFKEGTKTAREGDVCKKNPRRNQCGGKLPKALPSIKGASSGGPPGVRHDSTGSEGDSAKGAQIGTFAQEKN